MPKVSVIIPVYNASQYLSKCIKSVSNQTLHDIEIIIINDGSTDTSQSIIEEYQKKDARIQLINQKNQGVSIARNTGLKIAKGDYIGFIDADDYVEVNYLEVLYNLINHPKGEMSLCGFKGSSKRFLTDGVIILNNKYEDRIIDLFKSYLIFAPYNKLYKTEIIKKNTIIFDKNINYGEDSLFNLNYLKFISRIDITSKVLYNYNVGAPNSLAKQFKLKRFIDIDNKTKIIEDYFFDLELDSNKSKKYLEDLYYWNLYNSIYELNNTIALKTRKETFYWIDTTLKFHYLNSDIKKYYKRKKTILINILFLKNKWLIYLYITFQKLIRHKN